jgi:hypothetical protein
VQIVEACLITRAANGGLIDMDDLLRRVMSRRARGSQTPSLDDLERAVKKLHVLGNGFDIIQVWSVCRYHMLEEILPEFAYSAHNIGIVAQCRSADRCQSPCDRCG